jgi:hypothetical protein
MIDLVSHIIRGSGDLSDQYVLESGGRVALNDKERGCWELFSKQFPQRDWDTWEYEQLIYRGSLYSEQEGEVARWVAIGGRIPIAKRQGV